MRKLNLLSFVLFLVGLLSACSKYETFDISDFRMDASALKNGEEIRVIYASQGPDENKAREYYYHVIAVSQLDGDTVNILTLGNSVYSDALKDSVFNFINDSLVLSVMEGINLETINEEGYLTDSLKSIRNTPLPKPTKVARDPKFDYIAKNKYPTLIGIIGHYSK
jgi:hypothetical protein